MQAPASKKWNWPLNNWKSTRKSRISIEILGIIKNLDDISWGIIIIRCRGDLARICAWQGNHNEAFPTAENEDFPRADIEITSKLLLVLTRNHKYVSNPKCNPILQMPRTRIKQNSDFFDKVKASKCWTKKSWTILRSNILFCLDRVQTLKSSLSF